ncbi:hypothetical protein CR203_03980 [Salipaludibacillus neizhouensis]|uniref:ATP-grasp domain-containing protein n=1 Tax=Salipaludibacillus neizhouensis TaxID=885475 RepID=A0A3A9KEX9_9BACI|nr:YheC/YheD family protein [Salipaludibacillus neizhouensis]RKL69200.1 hypothetical protein CR203_03980 [Salipaludibacillus neizhouensis]
MSKQVLGILMNRRVWKNARNGKGYEKVRLYLEAAKKYNVEVCFFSLSNINVRNGTVLTYFNHKNKWYQRRVSIPKVIHNRAKLSTHYRRNLEVIEKKYKVIFYNSWNNYSKLQIHNILNKNTTLRPFLPSTHLLTKGNLLLYSHLPSFFLKPDKGSLGKGIIKVIKHSPNSWKIHFPAKNKKKIIEVQHGNLFLFISKFIGRKRYIIQETINLQTYHKQPFDIRVSIQKDQIVKWRVSGMVGKVAAKGAYLSNVHQGGSTVKFEHLFPNNQQMIRRNLSQISQNIIQHLDKHLPLLADVGIDFGIDKSGKPFFIEVNFRDQRYSFLNAGMKRTFKLTYDYPVGYGKYLLGR